MTARGSSKTPLTPTLSPRAGRGSALSPLSPFTGRGVSAAYSAFSIVSASETSNLPGASTCYALTTPLSTSIE